jgi:hypothetical protein
MGHVLRQEIDMPGLGQNRRKVFFYQHFRQAARAAEAFGHHRHPAKTASRQTIE